jgi:hypothetical protein
VTRGGALVDEKRYLLLGGKNERKNRCSEERTEERKGAAAL